MRADRDGRADTLIAIPHTPSAAKCIKISRKCIYTSVLVLRCGDSVHNTLLPNPNVLVAVSKGMRAVKLCTNKILQFLTGGAG